MFRKYYKQAMDDIKPREAFVAEVIENAKKRKPPAYTRYTKYAAAVAAAVVIVSGTVLSMPLWQRVTDNADGVIIEEKITDTAPPESTPSVAASAAPTAAPADTAAPQGARQPKHSSNALEERAPQQTAEPEKTETVTEPMETQAAADSGAEEENGAADETPMLRKAVLEEVNEEVRIMSEPQDMAAYGAATDASEAASAKTAAMPHADLPAPEGYYCTNASPRGYTFENDSGAVITVTINYGGEERDVYIEENGDSIYAVFTSFGLSVTINASGAERAAVEEIINSLR